MQTAPGQAVSDSSNRGGGRPRARRRGLSPVALGVAAFLLFISLVVMGTSLAGIWPPKSDDQSKTLAQAWQESRTATPANQYVNGLKVEKVAAPRSEGDTVTVTLKVTNNVMMPAPNGGGKVQATVFAGMIRVLFYNVENGRQLIAGGGYGNVVNLKYGESQTIEVVCTPVHDYSQSTGYDAFPDSVWTDQDAAKGTPTSDPGGTPSPASTP